MNEELCIGALKGAGIVFDDTGRFIFREEDSPGLGFSALLQGYRISSEKTGDENCLLQIIYKSNPDLEHSPESLFDLMFTCEIKMYKNILPHFDKLFAQCHSQLLWPKIYLIPDQNNIIMEDLKKSSYRTNIEESGSTLEEAILAITSLAKFHAASIISKSQGNIIDDSLKPYFYCRGDKYINNFFEDGLKILSITVKQSLGNEWSDIGDKLMKISQEIGDMLLKIHMDTEDRFKVINHGDFWRANLMYQYDDDNKPISLKFVDFQLSHYGSIGWDLAYYFYLNPNLNLRYKHFNYLLTLYQKSMEDFLKCNGYEGPIFTLNEIENEFNRFILYGFLKCCTDLPYQICSFKGGIDAENLFKYNDETDKLKLKLYSSEKYIDILKIHIGYLKDNKLI